jgi:hypothetical protein
MTLTDPPIQHTLLNDKQRFQYDCVHQIDRYGAIVGELRIENGQIITPPPEPTIAQRHISGGFKAITATNTAIPLSDNNALCQSVQIIAVRSDWSDNVGRIGIGDVSGWYSALDPMGMQLIEAPPGGVLNLKNVFIYGNTVGDQVRFLVLNTI